MARVAKLKEIAQHLGVSQSTVSKALNNATDINAETRGKILRVAAKMGYGVEYPEIKGAKTIGIICPEIKSNYYAQVITAIEKNIAWRGYGMMVAFSDFQYESEQKLLQDFIGRDSAGIVLLSENRKIGDDLKIMRSRIKIPIVAITLDIKIDEFDTLMIDDAAGIEMIVDHLTALGHTNIGFISDAFTIGRLEHFKNAMCKKGLETRRCNIYIDENGRRFEECGYAGAAALEALGKNNMPTAAIAGYDDIAIGAMRLFKERRLRIPEDISLAGIDNISVAPYLPASLTTVAVPVEELGEIATKILLRKVRDPGYGLIQQVMLRPMLIIRESTSKRKNNADAASKN